MGALIDQTDIGRAVFSLVQEGSPTLVSARALAQRLHVSVGALYNYAGSMEGALHAGERYIESQLEHEHGVTNLKELLAFAERERPAVEFLLDPHRVHPDPSPWLASILGRGRLGEDRADRGSLDPALFTDHLFIDGARNLVGRLLGDLPHHSPDHTMEQLPASWSHHFAQAIADVRANPKPVVDLRGNNVCQQLLDLAVRFISGSNLPQRQARVRCASLTLLLSEGEAGWKFRALSNLSGVPLAALHNMGSRQAHLQRSLNDLVMALFQVALRDANDDVVGAYELLPDLIVSAPDTLLENFSTVAVPSVISQFDILRSKETLAPGVIGARALALTAVYSILMSAWLRRDRDPASWALVPQIAVSFIRSVRSEWAALDIPYRIDLQPASS